MKFRFVDRILDYRENDFIEGIKTVSLEEYFLTNRLGIRKQFPPTLMAESLFQLANFLVYKSFHTRLAILTMFNRIEIREPLGPGDAMRMRVKIDSIIGDSIKMSGVGHVDQREVIRGDGCIGILTDLDKLYDPDDYNRLFNVLCENRT